MSWAIWVTGRPGSGKSSVARAVAARLAEQGTPVTVLELDRIRRVLTPAPTYSEAEREIVYRALVYMAVVLTEAGVPVVIDATAHRRAWRDLARASIARFAEVQLDCPLEVAQVRERTRPRGEAPPDIYAHAGRPGATVPGMDVPYERAESPELAVDPASRTSLPPPSAWPRCRWYASARTGGPAPTAAPSSGSPDLLAAARRPRRRGWRRRWRPRAVKRLEWVALCAFVLRGGPAGAIEHDVAHRALAYTANLFAQEGLTVVVDATAPRRVWRALARKLTATFAEVQLVCPREICDDRERAVRWGAPPCPPHTSEEPDVGLEYEYSLDPDLLLDTAVRGEWTVAEDLLRLSRRLLRRRVAG